MPRVFYAYSGPNKKELLSTLHAMIVRGALPEHGQKRRWSREVTQHDLAKSSGLGSRSTFTRRIGLFAPVAIEDRQAVIGKLRKLGKSAAADKLEGRKPHAEIVRRQRRFARANSYSFALPERRDPKRADCYFPPELKTLLEHPDLGRLWREMEKGHRGHKDLPQWLYDSRLPISDTARLVMGYYFMCGLLDRDPRTGRARGIVRPRQSTVAAALGISKASVYRANCQLAEVGLIRVAHERRSKDGNYTSSPQIIVYLPVRILTHEEAEAELERFLKARAALQNHAGADAWLDRATGLHGELLRAWANKEHAIASFWREIRRQFLAANLPRRIIDSLIPRPPE